jgi:YcdC-like protein, C-terminal region
MPKIAGHVDRRRQLKTIEPNFLFYMIWATTHQYANVAHENGDPQQGPSADDNALERAKSGMIEIICAGCLG